MKYNKISLINFFFILFILFFIFLYIRIPHLKQPLGMHNQNASAHVLVTMEAMRQNSFNDHCLLPIYTYSSKCDKWVNDMPPSSISDDEGNYFYTSFPPLSFILPYLWVELLNLDINEINLRIFNLVIQFLSIIFLAKLLLLICPLARKQTLIAIGIYLFIPEVMWSQSNAYWSYSLAQLFFYI